MKLTYEQKLLVIEDYFKIGSSSTANKWGLHHNYVKELVRLLQNNSLQAHGKKNIYTPDFKIKVAKAYANGEGSLRELSIKFGIPSYSIIIKWYYIYQSQGEEGLRNMKKQGRPRNSETKSTKSKVNVDKLLQSEKSFSEYSPEEEKSLKEELLRLRCHEEFSKKFEALAQDYLRKKNNK